MLALIHDDDDDRLQIRRGEEALHSARRDDRPAFDDGREDAGCPLWRPLDERLASVEDTEGLIPRGNPRDVDAARALH
jgi:hypothetical protein